MRLIPIRILSRLVTIAAFVSASFAAQDMSDEVRLQIQSILAQKRQFSPAQTKVSSNLVFAAKAARSDAALGTISDAIRPIQQDSQGRVAVEVKGNVTAGLMGQIENAGGTVTSQSPLHRSIQATIPLTMVDVVAAHPDVDSIRLPARKHTNGRGARMRPGSLMNRNGLSRFVGAVTSQGYISHAANQTFAANFIGAGVKVGVLSDSATVGRVAALIASGDLPADTVILPGEGGDEIDGAADEGTAMMEIIHDLAPGAQLYFATAFHSDTDFANNILKLRQAGCKVIVDDVSYSAEGAFQDGVIAQAINAVVAAGSIYFSSAANSGNLTNGTSGTWEGDFLSGGPVSGLLASGGETGLFHNFRTSGSAQLFDVLRSASPFDDYVLQWSDPLGLSTNDYDLFLLNSTGTTLKGFSVDAQNGAQDPVEEIYVPGKSTAGDRLVVVLYDGVGRALHLDTERGTLTIATAGATFGHNAARNTVTMAATAWNSARAGTRPFTGFANPTEVFSSDGPRKIFYQPDGTPITPGNFLFQTNGGTTLQKPDLTAADGVYTKTPGFLPFFGTSAAAPHAAAVAALVLGVRPNYTPAQVKEAMTATALDTMAPGPDRDAGYGIATALAAVQYALSH